MARTRKITVTCILLLGASFVFRLPIQDGSLILLRSLGASMARMILMRQTTVYGFTDLVDTFRKFFDALLVDLSLRLSPSNCDNTSILEYD